MKKNGFTLVELLVTIVLISLIMAVAVPSSITIGNRIKKKLLNDKLELGRQASLAWVNENHSCFSASKPCSSSITYVSNNSTSYTVKITLGQLAKDNLYNYDNKEKKLIENPVDKSSMNNKTITIVYNIKNKSARSTLD